MKNVLGSLIGLLLFFSLYTTDLPAEEKKNEMESIDIAFGLGIPELINIGPKIQLEPLQIGFFIGSVPISNELIFSTGAEIDYHFAGKSKYSDRPIWSFKLQGNYLYDETETKIVKYVYLTPGFGFDINFSKEVGMNVYAGLSIELLKKEIEKKPQQSYFNFDFSIPFMPSIGVSVFYRIF